MSTDIASETKEAPKKGVVREVESGSKGVYLRAKPLQNQLPKVVQADAVSKLSSIFVDRQPLRGLSSEEEKKYLATMLEVGPDDREWSRHTRKFWAELRIPVGFAGVPLEIGTDESGWPLKLMDYIKYRFAKAHKMVAESEAEMLRSATYSFYILNPSAEITRKNNQVQVAKLADREFIKSCDDVTRMGNLLRILSKSNVKLSSLSPESIENMLYTLKQEDPKKFLEVAKDPNLDMKAEMSAFVELGVLQKVGNSYINIDETIGDDLDEAVRFLKDPKRSGLLNTLRTRYKEALR